MKKKKVDVPRKVKMLIGCVLLIISGMGLGMFETMKYFLALDGTSLWIPITSLLFLLIGMIFLLYRDEQVRTESSQKTGRGE